MPGYGPIFNAGMIFHDERFLLLARGVREGHRRNEGEGPRFLDYRSDVLQFSSEDGVEYDFEGVLAVGDDEAVWSYEDPRVQSLVHPGGGSDPYMTYTNLAHEDTGLPWRIGIHRLVVDNGLLELNRTSGRIIGPPGVPDKDAVLFNLSDGRLAMIHRVHPNIQLALFDSIDDLIDPEPGYWEDHLRRIDDHVIIRPSRGALGVGAGAPPVGTDDGLLFLYHERGPDGVYRNHVCLLDPGSGTVSAHLPEPVLVPELPWERRGDVDDVVFVQGAHRVGDGNVYVTYGAADRAVGAGLLDERAVLDAMVPGEMPNRL